MSDTTFIERGSDYAFESVPGYVKIKDPAKPGRGSPSLIRNRFWTLILPGTVALGLLLAREGSLLTLTEMKDLMSSAVAEPDSVKSRGAFWPFAKSQASLTYDLNGIIFSAQRPMAMINQQAFDRDEIASVKTAEGRRPIHCVEINPADVRIRIPGGEERVLSLAAQ